MQAEATAQPTPTSRNVPVRKPFVILAILALIGIGIYGYNAGWFKDTRSKASDLLATTTTSVGDFFSKFGGQSSTVTVPPAVTRNTSPLEDGAPPALATASTVDIVGDNAPPATTRNPGADEALSMARNAFAAGDINAAIEGYRALLAGNPDDIAALGELGNVFYAVGMKPAAAQAFFDVANKALDQGQFEFAANLLPAVIEGNPMLATQLNNRLFDAYARSNMGQPEQQMPAMYQPYQPPMPPFMRRGEWR